MTIRILVYDTRGNLRNTETLTPADFSDLHPDTVRETRKAVENRIAHELEAQGCKGWRIQHEIVRG